MQKFILCVLLLGVAVRSSSQQSVSEQIDSTISVFWDTNLKVRIQIFNRDEPDEKRNNALLTLISEEEGRQHIVYRDSFFAYTLKLALKDLNGDGMKDLLIFNVMKDDYNRSFHLYLVDQKLNRLTRVRGFEKVLNPEYDWKRCVTKGWESYERRIVLQHYIINNSGRLFLATGVFK